MVDMLSAPENLRLLIVAGDPLARAGLASLLDSQPGVIVVGRTTAGANLASEIGVYDPDVILWDFGWNPPSSLEMLVELGESSPPVVVLLSGEDSAAAAVTAGARGLLGRDAAVSTIMAALRAVAEGLFVFAPEFHSALSRPAMGTPSLHEALTPREMEVLRLLAEGLPNKSIAQRLGISEHTAKFHVNAIMGKLGAESRTEAVVIATRLGLILL